MSDAVATSGAGAVERLREVVLDLERAKETERALREEAGALLEGLKAIAEARSADELFARLLQAMRAPLSSDVALVLREVDGALRVVASTDAERIGLEVVAGKTLARALGGRVTTLIDTSSVGDFAQPALAQVGSALLLPLAGERSRALIVFGTTATHTFGPRHEQLVKRLAPLANQALRDTERSEQIARQHKDMRNVLDTIGQGLLVIDMKGVIVGERSAQIDRWFGAVDPQQTLASLIARVSPRAAEWIALGIDELSSDWLPREVALAQLPTQLSGNDSTYRLDYVAQPPGAEVLTSVLVVVTDITDVVARERTEAAQREFVALVTRLLRDRSGFESFFEETEALINVLRSPGDDVVVTKRALHTLKGNAALVGLVRLSSACHHAEDLLADGGNVVDDALYVPILAHWQWVTSEMAALRTDGQRAYPVPVEELDQFIAEADKNEATRTLAKRAARWRLEPVSTALERLADHGRSVAAKLGKEVEVVVESDDARTGGELWRSFFGAYIHCVRNAIDHGIESPDDRAAANKSDGARLVLRARHDNEGHYVIETRDNGRGIDWARVAEKAKDKGLPHETQADLVSALFHDGFSTRDSATELSGRGLGVGVVKAACEALGGTLSVESAAGLGTTILCRFPAHAVE
jgi:two-component system chemotaxis sensor kinase CheA